MVVGLHLFLGVIGRRFWRRSHPVICPPYPAQERKAVANVIHYGKQDAVMSDRAVRGRCLKTGPRSRPSHGTYVLDNTP